MHPSTQNFTIQRSSYPLDLDPRGVAPLAVLKSLQYATPPSSHIHDFSSRDIAALPFLHTPCSVGLQADADNSRKGACAMCVPLIFAHTRMVESQEYCRRLRRAPTLATPLHCSLHNESITRENLSITGRRMMVRSIAIRVISYRSKPQAPLSKGGNHQRYIARERFADGGEGP